MFILNHLPLTKIKVTIARFLYRILHFVMRGDRQIISRGDVKFEVDISEGIDLALFLFGNFQKHVTSNQYLDLLDDMVVVDVGANCGIVALKYAQRAKRGHVYAFEPTDYAFAKLTRNLELNPQLSSRISAVQYFVSNKSTSYHNIKAYSSWKVDNRDYGDRHPLHCGINKANANVPAVSLDDFFTGQCISRIDLIKIDTDGHELDVLCGAKGIIKKYTPKIIFEAGLYLLEERGISFSLFCTFFSELGYQMINAKTGKSITSDSYLDEIPPKATIDILAFPCSMINTP